MNEGSRWMEGEEEDGMEGMERGDDEGKGCQRAKVAHEQASGGMSKLKECQKINETSTFTILTI